MAKEETNNSGLVGVILGIVAIAVSFDAILPALLISITGLIFSYKQAKLSKSSWSRAGKILNIIALAISIILAVVSYFVLKSYSQ